jgi:hypothetical protein
MRSNFFISALLVCAAVQGATLTVGNPPKTDGNCIPFGCPNSSGPGLTTFQQVYNANLFSNPILITGVRFFNTAESQGSITPATYSFGFTTTAKVPGALDLGSAAANASSGVASFWSGQLGGPIGGGSFQVIASNPFLYDPTKGNLLLQIDVQNPDSTDSFVFLDVAQSASDTSRAYFPNPGGVTVGGAGLVTEFTFRNAPASTVPEPSSAFLMLGGLGVAAGLFRRKSFGR